MFESNMLFLVVANLVMGLLRFMLTHLLKSYRGTRTFLGRHGTPLLNNPTNGWKSQKMITD